MWLANLKPAPCWEPRFDVVPTRSRATSSGPVAPCQEPSSPFPSQQLRWSADIGDVQADEGLAEELVSQAQRWGVQTNWHIAMALLTIYVANAKPEKALSFIEGVTDGRVGKTLYHPVRLTHGKLGLSFLRSCCLIDLFSPSGFLSSLI